MTKSYVKIYGPPVCKAIRALEKIVIKDYIKKTDAEMPEISIFSSLMATSSMIPSDVSSTEQYLAEAHSTDFTPDIPASRKVKLVSKSGSSIGEYDFFFDWEKKPSWKQLENLIEKIDKALKPLGCMYTITTK